MKTKNKHVTFAIKSRKGRRLINQDYATCSYNEAGYFCACICDGVGSVRGSENASRIVGETLMIEFEKTSNIEMPTAWFKSALLKAMQKAKAYADLNNLPSISTTLVFLMILGNKYYIYNIGDSRGYWVTKDSIKQLTYDHTYENYLKNKNVSEEVLKLNEAKLHALTQYIDVDKFSAALFEANSDTLENKSGWFFLTTDGITDKLSDDTIRKIVIKQYFPLALRCSLLNAKALSSGSTDNVTNIIVRVK